MNQPRSVDQEFLRGQIRPRYGTGSGEVTLVDLFSGCGGMALGVAYAAHLGGKAVRIPLAIDNDKDAVDVFGSNFPGSGCVPDDVCEWFDGALDARFTATERRTRSRVGTGIDFLLGGPPCQGNSNLNNHTRRNDPRNALYGRMARATRVLEPRFVVVENVPDVLRDHGRVVEVTKEALERDYRVDQDVLDLWRIGVPQHRKRHLLIASRRDQDITPEVILKALRENVEHSGRDVQWAIADLLDLPARSKFDIPSVPRRGNIQRMEWLFENEAYDLPNELRPPCHQNNSHTYKSVYGRLRWDRPAQTITTGFGSMGQGRYVHPARQRTITPHEAARLQCFPDFFDFGITTKRGTWARMIGNAVPPLLTMRIAGYALEDVAAQEDAVTDLSSQRPLTKTG